MYLHLGNSTVVNTENIIAIFDLESTSVSKYSKEFLKISEEEEFIKNVSEEIPKSYILCDENGQSVVYLTNISTKTLCGRIERVKQYTEVN